MQIFAHEAAVFWSLFVPPSGSVSFNCFWAPEEQEVSAEGVVVLDIRLID